MGCDEVPSVSYADGGAAHEEMSTPIDAQLADTAMPDGEPTLADEGVAEDGSTAARGLDFYPLVDPEFALEALPDDVRDAHRSMIEFIETERATFTNPALAGGYDVPDAWTCPAHTRIQSFALANTVSEGVCTG